MSNTVKCGNCSAVTCAGGKPLRRCTNCMAQFYCSKKCQTNHWMTHKHACKKSTTASRHLAQGLLLRSTNVSRETVWAGAGIVIAVFPSPMGEAWRAHDFYARETVPAALLQSSDWKDVAISEALGFPLRTNSMPQEGRALDVFNSDACALGLQVDPNHPYFGQACWPSEPKGTALLVRKDGGRLHVNHVSTLVRFAKDALEKVRDVEKKEAKGEVIDKRNLAARLTNPESFKKFFKELKEAEAKVEPNAWEGVMCLAKV